MQPSIRRTTAINPINRSPLRRGFLLIALASLALAISARANGPRALFSSSAAQSRAATPQPALPLLKELQPHALWSNDSIIYDNGGPNQQEGNEMTEWIQAEDFNLSADATLMSVNSWDIEAPGGTAYQGEIDWILYADAGGMPGASFASGAAKGGDVTRTFLQSGVLGLFDEYSLSFDISPGVALTAGTTYWLGLHNGPLTMTVRSEFYWEATNYNGTFTGHEDVVPFDGDWGDNEIEHAFNLVGEGGGGGDLTLESTASRKTDRHNSFDVPLPGVEDRTGATRYVVVMTFNNNVTGADSASSSCGTTGSISVDPADSHNLLVTFNGATCNAMNVTVTANNVHDDMGNTLASAETTMGILIGDVNGDGRVGNGDIGSIQGHLGEGTDSDNFRNDINADGRINNQDVQMARSHRGESLP